MPLRPRIGAMKLTDFNAYCASLSHANLARQWNNAWVWKVDVKLFAAAWERESGIEITFKASDIGFEILKDMPGLRPAPYMASRGMKWIQQYEEPGLDDDSLREHLLASYTMASRNLTKKRQKELDLNQD